MTKALPDPPIDCLAVNEHLSFEDAQLYIAHLIHSASATVLDCGDHLPPPRPRQNPRRVAPAGNGQNRGRPLHRLHAPHVLTVNADQLRETCKSPATRRPSQGFSLNS